MTKAGGDSKIADIRVYMGPGFALLADYRPIAAFTARVVLGLRSANYSFGSASHLYVRLQKPAEFSPEKKFGPGFDHWVWYADNLVQENFETLDEAQRFRIVTQAVRASLLELTPDWTFQINDVCDAAINVGSAIRFPVKSRKYRNVTIEVSVNVADHPDLAVMKVEVIDPSSDTALQTYEVSLANHQHAYMLASGIKVAEQQLILVPRSSFSAQLELRKYDLPLTFELPS
jgi:hypothetical protein